MPRAEARGIFMSALSAPAAGRPTVVPPEIATEPLTSMPSPSASIADDSLRRVRQ
jgi:hypothetical protein